MDGSRALPRTVTAQKHRSRPDRLASYVTWRDGLMSGANIGKGAFIQQACLFVVSAFVWPRRRLIMDTHRDCRWRSALVVLFLACFGPFEYVCITPRSKLKVR